MATSVNPLIAALAFPIGAAKRNVYWRPSCGHNLDLRKPGMRLSLSALSAVMLAGCGQVVSPVEQIDIRLSGPSSLDVMIDQNGAGRFHSLSFNGNGQRENDRAFRISPAAFSRLLSQLDFVRSKAVPFSDKSVVELSSGGCPKGENFVTDQGAIYLRWRSKGSDTHYLAQLGCISAQNTQRNVRLMSALKTLPIDIPARVNGS